MHVLPGFAPIKVGRLPILALPGPPPVRLAATYPRRGGGGAGGGVLVIHDGGDGHWRLPGLAAAAASWERSSGLGSHPRLP